MRLQARAAAAALLVLVAVATASAEVDPADSSAEPVRVYTNADLEALEPLPTQAAEPPTAEEIESRWQFVQSVLDQSYARIDADRRHELDRRLAEAQADALDGIDSRPRYVLPFSYYGSYGNYGGFGPGHHGGGIAHGRHDRGHPAASRLWERPNAEQFRPITPIHARPYQNNLFRFEARRHAPPGAVAPPAGRR